MTWKNGNESGNKVEFRHEIEYGITDRLQASLYVVFDSKAGGDKGAHAAFHEIEFPEWSDANDSIVYIGPNASFRYKRFWVTATALLQVTGISEEPELQLRAIFSVEL